MDKVFSTSKAKNVAFALAFLLLWGGLALLNFLLPEQEFSQQENRSLASFPYYTTARLLDGRFMDDMNTYLNDQFVARGYWVGAQSLIEYGLGKREINGVYIGRNALFRNYTEGNPATTEANIMGINAFAQRYGIPTYAMLVPSSTYINRQQLPAWAPVFDEGAYIQDVYGRLSDEVTAVNLLEVLAAESSELVYYRTDHHWTSYGAWLGFKELARVAGLASVDAQPMIQTLSTRFYGTNYSRVVFPLVQPDTLQSYQIGQAVRFETFGTDSGEFAVAEYDSIFFPEFLEQRDKYSYFLGRLQPFVTIYTNADTDKKLIIFKDSYAHSMVPMLMEDYCEIRLVDLRSFVSADYGAFVEAERYDEALFLYSTDVFSNQLGPGHLAG